MPLQNMCIVELLLTFKFTGKTSWQEQFALLLIDEIKSNVSVKDIL